MAIYGNLTIVEGSIVNLKVETGELPDFNPEEIGRLFVLPDGTLKLNNGVVWSTVQLTESDTSPLINTLGTNWIHNDLTFNPDPFNNLANISGLNSNNSLFDVIAALDTAITNAANPHFSGLSDVSLSDPQDGDVIYYNNGTFSNISLQTLANLRLTLSTTSLNDVEKLENYSNGDMFIFSQQHAKFVNRKLSYLYTNTASNTEFEIIHNLGQQFPIIQVVKYLTANTFQSIGSDKYTISYTDADSFILTLNTAAPIKVVVMGLNDS